MELLKTCTRCKISKPKNSVCFPLHNKCSDGLDSWCRACRNSYKRIERKQKKYNLTDSEFKILNNIKLCMICNKEPAKCIDHCHKTGIVRGVLCNSCNLGLGKFKDNIESLQTAIKYLEQSQLKKWNC